MKTAWCWAGLATALLALGAAGSAAAEAGAKKGAHKAEKGAEHKAEWLPSVEAIVTKLGTESAPTQEQKARIQTLRDDLLAKYRQLCDRDDVKAARAELEKAKSANDKDLIKVAHTKLRELMGGFSLKDEFEKGLAGILTEAQMAKLVPAKSSHGEKGQKQGRKKAEGNKERAEEPGTE